MGGTMRVRFAYARSAETPSCLATAVSILTTGHSSESEIRRLQILPDGLIYHPYLAGPKESRTGIQFFSQRRWHWSWYSTVGGQLGILRYGTYDEFRPVGIQFDIEGSAQFRRSGSDLLDFTLDRCAFRLSRVDRVGIAGDETGVVLSPRGAHRQLFESLLDQPDRIFERQAIVLGHSIHLSEKLRIYGEAGYAFQSDMSGEWEFQFGAEFAPVMPTRIWGGPFAAANVYLLEADDYGGNLTLEAGWCWRGRMLAC